MATVKDIRKTAQNAYEVCTDIDNYDIDELFSDKHNDANWFIEKNLDVLYRELKCFDDDEIMEVAKGFGLESEDIDEAKEIVYGDAEEEFAYLMESWWDGKLAELKNEATTPKAGMTRVYRVYATDIWRDNEWTEYVGEDYEKAREAAIDEDEHLTRADNKIVIFAYNDYKTEEVMHLSDEEIKDLMEGAEEQYLIPKAVWGKQS